MFVIFVLRIGTDWIVERGYRKPEPFEIEVRPRSEAVDRLVRAVEVEHPWTDEYAECIAHLQLKRK